jgi:hypothetical protein
MMSGMPAVIEDPFGLLGIAILVFVLAYILIRILTHRH